MHAAENLEPGNVADYLSKGLGCAVKVDSIKRSFPGDSMITWLVQTTIGNQPEGFIIRIEPPEGSGGPAPLKQEYQVYKKLFRSEIPVAEPLWYAEKVDFVSGQPHMIRRMVEGSGQVPGLFDNDADAAARRRRVAFECVEKLAMVHRLDWKALGFDEILESPETPGESFATELRTFRGYWNNGKPYSAPILEETFAWLSEIVPTDTPRISLVKGNNGLGEEIWRDEKIAAMSDWELACLSDGISDLFWSQGTVRLIGFEEVLKYYEEIMEQAVSTERLVYANLFALVKQMVCATAFWYRRYHRGLTKKPYSFAAQTFIVAYQDKFARCLGKPLDEVWQIINGGEKSMYIALGGSKK